MSAVLIRNYPVTNDRYNKYQTKQLHKHNHKLQHNKWWLVFGTVTTNININICSGELKWDGKKTKIWYDNEMRWGEYE